MSHGIAAATRKEGFPSVSSPIKSTFFSSRLTVMGNCTTLLPWGDSVSMDTLEIASGPSEDSTTSTLTDVLSDLTIPLNSEVTTWPLSVLFLKAANAPTTDPANLLTNDGR